MVAYIDIRFTFLYVLFSFIPIMYEVQYAKYPRPQCQEFIADPSELLPQQERQQNAGEQDDHENREDQEHPDFVKQAQERTYNLQRFKKLARNILKDVLISQFPISELADAVNGLSNHILFVEINVGIESKVFIL